VKVEKAVKVNSLTVFSILKTFYCFTFHFTLIKYAETQMHNRKRYFAMLMVDNAA